MQSIKPLALVTLAAAMAGSGAFAQPPQPGQQQGPGDPAKAFIEQLDKDGDGKVSKEEALAPQGPRFEKADTDGDGVITAEEASESFKAQVPAEMVEAMEERGMPDPGKTFVDNLDQNDDGQVDPEEFEQPTVEAFERMDTNDDGFADQAEAQAYFDEMKQQMEQQMRQLQQQQQQQMPQQ